MADPTRQPGPEELWDRFINAIDSAGQAGDASQVVVPTFITGALGGRRFGDLSKDDVKALARVASGLARRSETIVTMWEDMKRRARPPKAPRAKRSRG